MLCKAVLYKNLFIILLKTIDIAIKLMYNSNIIVIGGDNIKLDIRERRLSSGLTQEELAEKMGKKQVTVSAWELGKAYPPSDLLPHLAEVLHCTVNDLFKEE